MQLLEARRMVSRLRQGMLLQAQLEAASISKDRETLEDCLGASERLGIEDTPAVRAAREALAELKSEAGVRAALGAAMDAQDVEATREALGAAVASGVRRRSSMRGAVSSVLGIGSRL